MSVWAYGFDSRQPHQLKNFLFDTNPRLWRGFLVGQEVFSLPNATRFAGLAFGGDGGRGISGLCICKRSSRLSSVAPFLSGCPGYSGGGRALTILIGAVFPAAGAAG